MISQGRTKIGKVSKVSIALFMLLNAVMLNAVIQTELENDRWQLVGFMGPQGSKSSVSYRQDTNKEIRDRADANTTYLVKESSASNGQLAYKIGSGATGTTNLSTVYVGTTTQIGASIGIFAIKGSRSPSGETTLASSEATEVKMKIANSKEFILNLPKYRMYLEGKGDTPSVRIDYQANYEGQKFKIKFGNETKDYIGYFNHSNTFISPAPLQDSASLGAGLDAPYFSPIQDAIDFNLNDNNLTNMIVNNIYTIKDTSGVYNKDLTDYSSSSDYDVIVYKFNNGGWEHFDSRNAKKSSNDFDRFDTAQGYWVKATNNKTTKEEDKNFLNPVKTGLITSSTPILEDKPYENIKNGWSLLSFKDTDIRYAPSGVFIPQNVWQDNASFGGIQVFFKSQGVGNGTQSGKIELGTLIDNNYSDTNSAARAINLAMQAKNDTASEFKKVRAIPAMDFSTDYLTAIPGIIIISDGLFELNTSGNTTTGASNNETIKTIANGSLRQLANGNYGSTYGEYMNFVAINKALDAYSDVNASLSVYVHNGKSSPQKVGGLNDGNNTNRLKNVLSAFSLAATKNGATAPYTNTGGYLTALNFNDTDDYISTDGNMTHMLIASGERYSISDSTFTKVYKYKGSGKFAIVSSKGSKSITTTGDVTSVVSSINAQKSNTGVSSVGLGVATGTTDEYFAIMSTDKGLELLEDDSSNLFEDVSLTDGIIPNVSRIQGSMTSVHSTNNLFNTDIVINRDVIDGNVSYLGVFDVNFTPEFEDNKTLSSASDSATFATTPWATQTVYIKNAEINLTGNHVIGGDLVIENATLRVGVGLPATLTVGGQIITIGSTVTLDFNASGLITTGTFNNRESNATDISQLYPSDGLITFNTDINLSNIDINGTKLAYNNVLIVNKVDLDKNVSDVAVGLFNLNGANFPSVSEDLQSNSHWVLDFPLEGGIIEDFHEIYGKKIKSILTMEYSSGIRDERRTYWRNTDLTKNIDTLYGNSYNTDDNIEFNNDYQGIFRIQPNKAYWVNIDNGDILGAATTDKIEDIIDTSLSKVTDQASAHFSNTFSDAGISTTQNHINHQLNIKFTKFLTGNSAYYNVVAIIKGKRYYLKRKGNLFSLSIDDNEMVLQEGTFNNQESPIILEVYDGEGTKIKEDTTNHHFGITFYKPAMPIASWDVNGSLNISGMSEGSTLEMYARSVSDIEATRDATRLISSNLGSKDIVSLDWNFDENDSIKGGLTPIRMMSKSVDGFYSDMRAMLYAPVDKGHVLVASNSNPRATNPFSYLQGQYLTKRDPNQIVDASKGEKNFPEFIKDENGNHNGVNGGIQLNLITAAIEGKNIQDNNIKMAYYPEGETEGAKELTSTGFDGSRLMYLRVNTGATGAEVIASIAYLPGYADKLFYISFNGKLYQGRFANSDAHNNDGNAYNLEGADLTPNAFIAASNPAQAAIGGASGVTIKSGSASQPIYAWPFVMQNEAEQESPNTDTEPNSSGDTSANNTDSGQLPN